MLPASSLIPFLLPSLLPAERNWLSRLRRCHRRRLCRGSLTAGLTCRWRLRLRNHANLAGDHDERPTEVVFHDFRSRRATQRVHHGMVDAQDRALQILILFQIRDADSI